jgi:hypothetical protein
MERLSERALHQILLMFGSLRSAAGTAHAVHDQVVVADPETVLRSRSVSQAIELITGELNKLLTSDTVQMIVLWISIVEVVDRTTIELEALQQTGFDEFAKGPINGRRTDVMFFALFGQSQHQFVGIKMLVLFEHDIDQKFPLCRLSLTPGLKKFFEPRHRRHRHVERRQRLGRCVHEIGGRIRKGTRSFGPGTLLVPRSHYIRPIRTEQCRSGKPRK